MDSITPYPMALIAKYIARHRLRETSLLDTIADFLVKKAEYLDSKVSPAPWWRVVRATVRYRCELTGSGLTGSGLTGSGLTGSVLTGSGLV